MSVLPIRYYGDPVLREKAAPVAAVDDELRRLAADMGETMYAASGIGLAANQVGVARRVLVLDVSDHYAGSKKGGKRSAPEEPHLEVYFNAEIVESSVEDGDYSEGCLSMPGLEGDVWRPLRIRVKWMDLDGKPHDAWIDGLRARVMQHEIDHLDGILFIDHLPTAERASLAGRLNRLKQETLDKRRTA